MKRFGSIYLIKNIETGKMYIGQTTRSVHSRFKDHARDKRSSRYLSSAIIKHGVEKFELVELLSCFDEDYLNEMESFYIEKYNTISPNGYNLSLGGHQRGEISDITRQKMRECKLGKKVQRNKTWSEDSRLNKSKAQNGRPIIAENLQTGETKRYEYIEAASKDGFHSGSIYKVLKGQRKSCKGHTFYYESTMSIRAEV